MRLRPAGHTAACLAGRAYDIVAGAFVDYQAGHTAACLAGRARGGASGGRAGGIPAAANGPSLRRRRR